jgi:hypothetical protein
MRRAQIKVLVYSDAAQDVAAGDAFFSAFSMSTWRRHWKRKFGDIGSAHSL